MILAVLGMLQTYLWPQRHYSLLLQSLDVLRMKRFSDDSLVCKIFTPDGGICVGRFQYLPESGRIDGVSLEPPYWHRDLEQQILIYMMKDMQDAGATHVWDVAPQGDKFYSQLWQFEFRGGNVHPDATGSGYIMPIPKDLRKLLIKPGIGMY